MVRFLGQAGLLFELNDKKIMIDPYLSNSVAKVNPQNHRRVAVDESIFNIKPDIMIFTHNHLDHYAPETVEKFITKDIKTVLHTMRYGTNPMAIGAGNMGPMHMSWACLLPRQAK